MVSRSNTSASSSSSTSAEGNDLERNIDFVDFWGTKVNKEMDDQGPPCVPNLDPLYGTLPSGTYTYEADDVMDPKHTCRICIDLSHLFQINQTDQDIIESCQRYLDSGFQTFQGASPAFIQQFQSQTPSSVVGKTHWAMKMQVPETITSSKDIRQHVFNLLMPMGASCDAIDTLHLQFNDNSPYHLDVLDIMIDLQREGWIRALGVENFPSHLIRSAISKCNFSIQTCQQEGNILQPPTIRRLIPNRWISNSLSGGLLTNHYSDWRDPPRRHRQWESTIRNWGRRQAIISDEIAKTEDKKKKTTDLALWKAYQEQVLDVLDEMAFRYGVSIKCIALRWALESDRTSSVVVPAYYWLGEYLKPEWNKHIRELRQAFTFRLEQEDKEILASLSKDKRQDEDGGFELDLLELEELLIRQGLAEHEIEMLLDQHQQDPAAANYPKIDFDNPTLWL